MDKKHILREIQRTAATNKGVPLGKRRFFIETGIKEYDWFGKYWARWSDAVREAGFTPNKLRSAYSEAAILNKYIELSRELCRLPVSGDLRLKTRRDPTFPNDKTFTNRYGTKQKLIERLVQYCKDHDGYEDILRLCNNYILPHEDSAPKEKGGKEIQIGFVYLIKSGRFYKIGRTNVVGRREYELAVQLPEKSSTVHVIRTDDPIGIEAYWHKRFEPRHKNGEWFELTASDIAAFRRRKFM